MSGKRALVVDDSRSARAFLSRLLEEHQLEVDSAETAEQAIDYLARHRPDVIFMDHLMPGMDGFQAVQAIKGNPRTATIPILMYTSQEGELYLGQARALGAIGVLPKSVERADVSKVLEQLHLTSGIRAPGDGAANEPAPIIADEELDLEAAAAAAEAAAQAAGATTLLAAPALFAGRTTLAITEDALMGLRADFERGLDARIERLLPQVRAMIRESLPQPPPPAPPRRSPWPWILVALAVSAATVFAALWWEQLRHNADIRAQLERLPTGNVAVPGPLPAPVALATSAAMPAAATATALSAPGPAGSEVFDVRFGETPLDGARTEGLATIVGQLAAAGFTGRVDVVHHEGRFCLTGSPDTGYALAGAALPYLRCDLMADASDPAIGGGSPESLRFANELAELRKAHEGRIRIEVARVRASSPDRPYPQIDGQPPRVPTAGDWNAAALENNRVEIRWTATP